MFPRAIRRCSDQKQIVVVFATELFSVIAADLDPKTSTEHAPIHEDHIRATSTSALM